MPGKGRLGGEMAQLRLFHYAILFTLMAPGMEQAPGKR